MIMIHKFVNMVVFALKWIESFCCIKRNIIFGKRNIIFWQA
jgi:hypothetical protein